MHTSSISNIHLRFHEILDFGAFLQVLHPFRIVSPASGDVSIVSDVFGPQFIHKDEICRYPEDPNLDRALSRLR